MSVCKFANCELTIIFHAYMFICYASINVYKFAIARMICFNVNKGVIACVLCFEVSKTVMACVFVSS